MKLGLCSQVTPPPQEGFCQGFIPEQGSWHPRMGGTGEALHALSPSSSTRAHTGVSRAGAPRQPPAGPDNRTL